MYARRMKITLTPLYNPLMKGMAIVVCAMLCCAGLHAQTKNFDRSAANPPNGPDTAYINNLVARSVHAYLQYPDSARTMAEEALLLSKQINYDDGIGNSFAAIGYSYWAQSYYAFSLYFLFSSEDYLKRGRQFGTLSMMYRIISRNYSEMEKYYEAAAYLKKSEANAMLSHDNEKIGLIYSEASLIDFRQKDYNEAWRKANTAMDIAFKYNDTLLMGIIYSRLGDIARQKGDSVAVKNYYDSAYRWSLLANNYRLRSLLLTDYATLYLGANNIDKALEMANAASALADSTGNITVKIKAAGIIANCFHARKDVSLALAYQVKYSRLQDSINDEYRRKGFQLFQQFFVLSGKLHDLEMDEHANIATRERIRFQHIIIMVLVMFVIILLAGLIVIYFQYKAKKILSEQLEDRNEAITHQKNIIEQQTQHLAELNDLKTRLFAVISHDLRTPIGSLRSIMQLFQKEGLGEEETVTLLKRMLPALDAADLTLSNLLNWAIKQMSGIKLNQATISLYAVIDEMQRVFEIALQQKQIALGNLVPPGIKVYFDEQHLNIILRNLLSNAIKFTPRGGEITISAVTQGDCTSICVRDNGQGMKADDIARLFKPGDHFTTRGTGGEKGTGLGLMLCKDLLELNGGTISIESMPGKGSAFYIKLTSKAGM